MNYTDKEVVNLKLFLKKERTHPISCNEMTELKLLLDQCYEDVTKEIFRIGSLNLNASLTSLQDTWVRTRDCDDWFAFI